MDESYQQGSRASVILRKPLPNAATIITKDEVKHEEITSEGGILLVRGNTPPNQDVFQAEVSQSSDDSDKGQVVIEIDTESLPPAKETVALASLQSESTQFAYQYPIPNWRPLVLRPWFIILVVLCQLGHLSGILWILLANGPAHDHYFRHLVWDDPDSLGSYFRWQFLFYLFQVFFGVVWTYIDSQVRRVLPYELLCRPEGATGQESICEDYDHFLVVTPMVALARKRMGLFCSSTSAVITSLILPSLCGILWELKFETDNKSAKPVLKHAAIYVFIGFTIAVLLLSSGFIYHTITHKSGLYDDFDNLAGLAAMICDSSTILKEFKGASFESNEAILECLKERTYRLSHVSSIDPSTGVLVPAYQLCVDASSLPEARVLAGSTKRKKPKVPYYDAHPLILKGRISFIIDVLNSLPVIVFATVLAVSYARVAGIASYRNRYSPRPDYPKPDPTVIKILYTLNYSIYTACSTAIFNACCRMEPYYNLQRSGGSHPKIHPMTSNEYYISQLRWNRLLLATDPRAYNVISNIFIGSRISCPITLILAFRVICLIFSTAIVPSLFELTVKLDPCLLYQCNQNEKAPETIQQLKRFMDGWVIFLNVLTFLTWLIVLINIRKPVVPRIPSTIASRIAYLVHSEKLLSDVRGCSMDTLDSLQKKLEPQKMVTGTQREYYYGLGYIERVKETGEKVYEVCIERGPFHAVYKYPETVPGQKLGKRQRNIHDGRRRNPTETVTAAQLHNSNVLISSRGAFAQAYTDTSTRDTTS